MALKSQRVTLVIVFEDTLRAPPCEWDWNELLDMGAPEDYLLGTVCEPVEPFKGELPAELDPWAEKPGHPIGDWQREVHEGDTMLGYAEWVEHRVEAGVEAAAAVERPRLVAVGEVPSEDLLTKLKCDGCGSVFRKMRAQTDSEGNTICPECGGRTLSVAPHSDEEE